jgi:hypothetical protein
MNAKEIERAAYLAAHRILAADISASGLACPGAQRSHAVDTIAAIIQGVFEIYKPEREYALERRARFAAEIVKRPRVAVVIELPRRASS